jgi:pimeloyl-ACP methyl ester carboxylesterase
VGHSLGGLIALLYARTYSSDVRGIVFVDALSVGRFSGLLDESALRPLHFFSQSPRVQDAAHRNFPFINNKNRCRPLPMGGRPPALQGSGDPSEAKI